LVSDITDEESGAVITLTNRITLGGWPAASLWFYILSSSNQELGDTVRSTPQFHVPSILIEPKLSFWTRTFRSSSAESELIEKKNEIYITSFEAWL
jgi:hypothetical protein